MAIINEIIKSNDGETLSFGNYLSDNKMKYNDFELAGNMYNVRTHNLVTRLEKNGSLLLETVPGAAVHDFKVSERNVVFSIEGFEDTQITMELIPETEYKIVIDDMVVGSTMSNKSGKINFSIELNSNLQKVKVEKEM